MTVNQVCRLCLSDKELVWIFDQKCNSSVNTLKDVIMITTGIEVLEKDVVSQKICSNCCNVTQKMFQFRERAAKTDKFLKDRCRELLKNNEVALKIPNTSVSIKKSETKMDKKNFVNEENKISIKPIPKTNSSKENKRSSDVIPVNKSENPKILKKKIHPSIEKIFCMYENIKLPSDSLNKNVNPVICMEMDSVETYFRQHNLDMKKHIQMVLRSNRASKKTGKGHSIESSKRNNEVINSIKEDTNKGNRKVSPIGIRLEGVQELLKYPGIENSTISKTNHNSTIIEKEKLTINNDCENQKISTINIKLGKGKCQSKRSLEDKSEEPSPTFKKRRLFSNIQSEQPPTLMQTLQLKQNLEVPRCDICNYPAKNSDELKKHHRQHFKCTYCKAKLKTVNYKETHDIKCLVKQALTRQAYVLLEKNSVPTDETNIKENKSTKNDEIIELSDDETHISTCFKSLVQSTLPFLSVQAHPQASASHQVQPQVSASNSALPQAFRSVLPQEALIPLDQLQTTKLDPAEHQASTSIQVQPTSKSTSASSPTQTLKSVLPHTSVEVQAHLIQASSSGQAPSTSILASAQIPTEPVSFSTAIVRPLIQITDNARLNTINTSGHDITVLKDLLKNNVPEIKFTNTNEVQSTYPSNDEIIGDLIKETAVFKNLLTQLYAYKIPVDVKKGDFKVCYKENNQSKTRKNIDHWYNTKPVYLRSENRDFNTPNFKNCIRRGVSIFAPTTPTIIQGQTSNIPTKVCNMQTNVGNNQGHDFSQHAQIGNVPRNIQTVVPDNINLQLHNLPSKGKNTATYSRINKNSTNMQQLENSMDNRRKPELERPPNMYFVPNQKQTSIAQRNTPIQTNNVQTPLRQYRNSNQLHKLPQQIPTTGKGKSPMIFSEALYNLSQNKPFSNAQYIGPSNNQLVTSTSTINSQTQSTTSQNSTSTSNSIGFNNIPSCSSTYFHSALDSVLYPNSSSTNSTLSQKPGNIPMLSNLINTNAPTNPSVQSLVPNLTTSISKTMSTNNYLSTNADTTTANSVVSKNDVVSDKIVKTSSVENINVKPLIRVRNLCELK